MKKFRVELTTVLAYIVDVEAENAEAAEEEAYQRAPHEVHGATYEESLCLELNDAWELNPATVEEFPPEVSR